MIGDKEKVKAKNYDMQLFTPGLLLLPSFEI
jgi:hypothetical protein